jgi:hypothetical protein
MSSRLPAELIDDYSRLFVNRRAYTVQSAKPHPRSGKHYYYRPKEQERSCVLTGKAIEQHLLGKVTIGLYAINPKSQRCKWAAIDADYASSLSDLLKLQWELKSDGIEAALEKSRRGGHLWILTETPLLASDCRVYIQSLAVRLKLHVRGAGLAEGIEVFPRQSSLRPGEFGNAIRGPLGVHQANKKRYFFYGADYTLDAQMSYLQDLSKLTEERLKSLISGMQIPEDVAEVNPKVRPKTLPRIACGFRILDHVQSVRKSGRNYWAQCPSCALDGHDRSHDNLAIAVDNPRKYRCWAGCTREMIREAVGRPVKAVARGEW